MDFNCTTDDPDATVSLLHQKQFGSPWIERAVAPNKIILKGQTFTLLDLIKNDAGNYKCKARDKLGYTKESGMTFFLISSVELPRHFVLIPNKAIIVIQGQDGKVTCEAEGASVATLLWKKETDSGDVHVPKSWVTNMVDRATNRVQAVLKITNAKVEDAGVYKCIVKVQDKTNYKKTRIRVDAPTAPTIVPFNGKTDIVEGSEKIVRCIAKGTPKPSVAWYRNDKHLNATNCTKDPKSCENIDYEVYTEGDESSLHTSYTTGVLKIRSALYPRDQAKFKCVASNGVQPPAELILDFNVQVPPRLLKRDQQLAEEGKESQVSCTVDKANPLPTFRWQYQTSACQDSDCSPDDSQWIPVPKSLLITPSATPTNKSIIKIASHQPDVFYRCQAFNSLGNDSQIIRFTRLATLKAMIEMDTVKTKTEQNERSTLQVYCIDRCRGFCPISFIKDDKEISSSNDPRVSVTYDLQPRQEDRIVLTVKNLTLDDSGSYRCVMTDLMGQTEFGSIEITVKKPLVFLAPPQVIIQGYLGQNVLINCSTNHVDAVVSLLHRPHPFVPFKERKPKPYKLRKKKQVFKILNIDARDAGMYSCAATDKANQSIQWPRFSGYFVLSEATLPEFFVLMPSRPLAVLKGQDTEIKCESEGVTTIELQWKKQTDSGEVPVPDSMVTVVKDRSTNRVRAILKITNAQKKDDGFYKCVVTVNGITDFKQTRIIVNGKI